MMEAVAGATAEDGVQLGENTGPGSKVREEARKCAAWTPAICEVKVGTKYKKMIKMEGSGWAQMSSALPQPLCVRSKLNFSLPIHKVSIPGNAGCSGSMLAQSPCTPSCGCSMSSGYLQHRSPAPKCVRRRHTALLSN